MSRSKDFDNMMSTQTLRSLAADVRFDSMPAKFRWSLEWAADRIDEMQQSLASEPAELIVNGVHLRQTMLGLIDRMRWISVSERLPEDGTWCWVNWDTPGRPFPAMRDSRSAGGWTNSDTWEDFDRAVTHWMPMPEPQA